MSSEPSECQRLKSALCECHKRFGEPERAFVCKHINHALATCLISFACPAQADAVRALCSSAGTSLKRAQCQQARTSLALCISSHQNQE